MMNVIINQLQPQDQSYQQRQKSILAILQISQEKGQSGILKDYYYSICATGKGLFPTQAKSFLIDITIDFLTSLT
jgi:hypothetical protein